MTFTFVARCPETNALGVVTCTTGRSVGSVVPHAEENVGAVATQHTTNVLHGWNGLRLLREGHTPEAALESTLALDPNPELRQVLIIDTAGRTSAHTGSKNMPWKGHVRGENYVAGGNNLVGANVLDSMIRAFEVSNGEPLHERLVQTIDAGLEAGGCNSPDHTSALLVVGIEEELRMFWRPRLDLRIDWSENAQPTKDLRRLYEDYKKWIASIRSREN
jgi:uncharacterized Ntn-hydrolase superfamily protein